MKYALLFSWLSSLWLLTLAFLIQGTLVGQQPKKKAGEINTPPAKGERMADNLKVGDQAADFTLPEVHGKGQVKLSSFQGKRPVVLIFGSYT